MNKMTDDIEYMHFYYIVNINRHLICLLSSRYGFNSFITLYSFIDLSEKIYETVKLKIQLIQT